MLSSTDIGRAFLGADAGNGVEMTPRIGTDDGMPVVDGFDKPFFGIRNTS